MATTVSQPGYFHLQGFTDLGALAVGGRIYTYTQGTTTKKNAYTEATGTTVHTYTSDGAGGEYIALNARGELPAPLYLTSGAYDITYKTAAGATVWTRRADPQGDSSLAYYLPAGTGAVSRTVQSKLREVVSVTDYGATGDGLTDDTAAIQAANTAAAAAGKTLFFPAGSYVYSPSASISIASNWEFENVSGTQLLCSTASYSGEFFRMTGPYSIENGWIRTVGDTQLGTGLKLSNTDDYQFTGNQRITRTRIRGFDKNIDCGNIYMLTLDNVRSEFGAEGFYCVPSNDAGDNGYITTHTHSMCLYSDNVRNVYYAPAIISPNVSFIGGAIQSSTGAGDNCYFSTLRSLIFSNVYFENSGTYAGIKLNDCDTTIDGAYINATGGIILTTGNNTLVLNNIYTATSTDILSIPSGVNSCKVFIYNSAFPASGNVLSGIDYGSIINSTIDGQFHANTLLNVSNADVELRLCPSAYPTDATTPRFARILAKHGGAGNPTSLEFQVNSTSANPVTRLTLSADGNVYPTSGTTGMTNGFFYIPSAAGAPSGVPTSVSGRVPMYYDTTNNRFYVYNGAWKQVVLA